MKSPDRIRMSRTEYSHFIEDQGFRIEETDAGRFMYVADGEDLDPETTGYETFSECVDALAEMLGDDVELMGA